MVGYHVIQPNGRVQKLRAETIEDRLELVRSVTEDWKEYCERNWLSGKTDDLFCGENKVKVFLNGLGYFLFLGAMEGIESDYKKVVRGSRELPMSSCPSYIEDAMYGNGSTIRKREDLSSFDRVLDKVDEKTAKLSGYYKKPARKTKPAEESQLSRFTRVCREQGVSSSQFTHAVVDVDGGFTYGGERYVVKAPQYDPVLLADGDAFYAMDRIICVDGTHFYDMAMHEVSDSVKKICRDC